MMGRKYACHQGAVKHLLEFGEDLMTENFPEDGLQFQPPLAMHHLSGGIAMLVGANRLAMLLVPSDEGPFILSIRPNVSVLSLMKDLEGLRVLGRTQFHPCGRNA
jgi:hypothetical protein